MTSKNIEFGRKQRPKFQQNILPLLDILAIAAWGVLLLKYWVKGELNLLIHPNYFWLSVVTGFALLALAAWRGFQLVTQRRQKALGKALIMPIVQHISLFPPGWSSALLIATAIVGLLVTPKVFNSQTAFQRGVTESLTMTRAQPQAFRTISNPAERSLIDWIRTLNVYPEPDAYTGQPVKVKGFAIHPPKKDEMDAKYLLIARFVITCCAADAYPVGLPVKLIKDRSAYPADKWFEVEGKMITENLNGKRQLTIEASSLKEVAKPANPYSY